MTKIFEQKSRQAKKKILGSALKSYSTVVFVCLQMLSIIVTGIWGSWIPQDRNHEPKNFQTNFIKLMLKHKGGNTEERKVC